LQYSITLLTHAYRHALSLYNEIVGYSSVQGLNRTTVNAHATAALPHQ
jgi:hypothetical protein